MLRECRDPWLSVPCVYEHKFLRRPFPDTAVFQMEDVFKRNQCFVSIQAFAEVISIFERGHAFKQAIRIRLPRL